jgi:hypothetical protein
MKRGYALAPLLPRTEVAGLRTAGLLFAVVVTALAATVIAVLERDHGLSKTTYGREGEIVRAQTQQGRRLA